MDTLCDDPNHGVRILKPKVHAAVIKRIESWEVAYAPVSFPSDYDVMARRGRSRPNLVRTKAHESTAQRADRVRDMQAAWTAVARRRQAYLATVWLTVLLALLPLADQYISAIGGSISAAIAAGGDVIRLPQVVSDQLLDGWLVLDHQYGGCHRRLLLEQTSSVREFMKALLQ